MEIFLAVLLILVPAVAALILSVWLQAEPDEQGVSILAGLGVGVLLLFFFITIGRPPQYRQGQIDAMNGKISYKLEVDNNMTTSWEYVDPDTSHFENITDRYYELVRKTDSIKRVNVKETVKLLKVKEDYLESYHYYHKKKLILEDLKRKAEDSTKRYYKK